MKKTITKFFWSFVEKRLSNMNKINHKKISIQKGLKIIFYDVLRTMDIK